MPLAAIPAVAWGGIAAGAGAAGAAALSSRASSRAGNQVAAATDQAAQLQDRQFQQLLRLQMPGYNRAEGAAGVYGAALGLPSMTGRPQQPQPYQTGQPGASVSYGGQGGYGGMMTGGRTNMQMVGSDGYSDFAGGYQPEGPQTNGGPGVGYDGQPVPMEQPGQAGQSPLDIQEQVRNTPGYRYQLDSGLKSIDRAAPLVGGMYSGRRMKALESHGQNTFGSYYNSWLDRVGGVAGQAPQIASNIGQQGAASAAAQGGLMVQGANARAQGQMSGANAWSGAIGTGIGLYGGSQGWFGR